MSEAFDVVIVGGGTGGISVAARLCNSENPPSVAIVEPSEVHYYQPIWTLVGGGVVDKEVSAKKEADYIPKGATWVKDKVATFEPDQNQVTLASGKTLRYEQLVVAAGIQLDWHKIKGLEGNLGKDGICSNYSYDTVSSTWEFIKGFKGGNAVFTFPATPIKCAGAPQKIMYLAEHHFRRTGIREKCEVTYASATPGIFGIPKYAAALNKIVEARNINTQFKHDLVEIRPKSKEAVFAPVHDATDEIVLNYDMIHVVPPQSAPDFIKESPLAGDGGWVDVDKHTTQHVRYPNVFSLGDASSLPCSKTGAAIRKQAPVTAQNLLAFRKGLKLTGHYDGYASCPLVTGYGRLILAEFGYDGKIMETFPFDQAEERYSMYALKLYGLPKMYWNGMLRGRM